MTLYELAKGLRSLSKEQQKDFERAMSRELIREYLDIVEILYFRGIELDKAILIGKAYIGLREAQ